MKKKTFEEIMDELRDDLTEAKSKGNKPRNIYDAYHELLLKKGICKLESMREHTDAQHLLEIEGLLFDFNETYHALFNDNENPSTTHLITKSTHAMNNKPITLKKKGVIYFVQQADIVYIEVSDNICNVFYMAAGIVDRNNVTKQLKEYEDTLNHDLFVRVSGKHLVNMRFVGSFNDGNIKLSVKYDKEDILIPLQKKKKAAFLSRFIL